MLTAQLTPAGPNYRTNADDMRFYNQVLEKLSVPGVQDAGIINTLPLDKGPTSGFVLKAVPLPLPTSGPV